MSKSDLTYIANADPTAIDSLYKQYKGDVESVDFGWRKFFEGFELGSEKFEEGAGLSENTLKEINVLNLIYGYRSRGHLFAKTNPLQDRRQYSPTLAIENFELESEDLDKVFNVGVELGIGPAKLKDIIAFLDKTYCQSIGVEFTYIRNPARRAWLQTRFEKTQNVPDLTIDEKRHFLRKLNEATVFENFIHKKYIGQKRFSLEGLECLIPALDAVIQYGAGLGVDEFVLGMAHRGRLNVLANIFQKSYNQIFGEFEGKVFQNEGNDNEFEGDVKYHLGYSTNIKAANGKEVHLRLADNPSHLEAVNPVVKGIVRAKLETKYNQNQDKICPILIHGDAAIAGQGIMYEVVQMSGLSGYKVGGTMHIVTNNQIGFTTDYKDARTSTYCTDVAKVTLCPVIHVNADDVEAVTHAIKLAMSYRLEFKCDIFIDLLGYRKYGHNEGDEPRFTQPAMYKLIDKHPNPREIYKRTLMERGEIDAQLAEEMEKEFRDLLQEKFEEAKSDKAPLKDQEISSSWSKFRHPEEKDFEATIDTSVKKETIDKLGKAFTTIPGDKLPIRKVQKLFSDRQKMVADGEFDWALGELMAYATLLDEGFPVRLAGQDVERGTFSHRHAVVKKEDGSAEYIPLNNLSAKQAKFSVYNSLLSEYAALGYEYGYSSVLPNALTIWEAQFGDFANGAQIVFDQFISSAEAKWGKFSGLTMLLPHGQEGQGPEHSSARLERYLQLCASGNMQVMNITTPANLFHALRRQLKRDFQVPCIIMSPKSLLRHPMAVSKLKDFTTGHFMDLIDDSEAKKGTKKVLMCSGKIYYDLLKHKQENKVEDVAIICLEQLYPLPEWGLKKVFEKYKGAKLTWVQEEPKNQGAWLHLWRYEWPSALKFVGRKSSASAATGFKKVHDKEQAEIVENAFKSF